MNELEDRIEELPVSKSKCLRILMILRDQGETEYSILFREADRRYTQEVEKALDTLEDTEYNFRKKDVFKSARIKSPSEKFQPEYRFLNDNGYIRSYGSKVSITDKGLQLI